MPQGPVCLFIAPLKCHETATRESSWFIRDERSDASLGQMPIRSPIAAESKEMGGKSGSSCMDAKNRACKIYFAIWPERPGSGVVHILHVRHWARHTANRTFGHFPSHVHASSAARRPSKGPWLRAIRAATSGIAPGKGSRQESGLSYSTSGVASS